MSEQSETAREVAERILRERGHSPASSPLLCDSIERALLDAEARGSAEREVNRVAADLRSERDALRAEVARARAEGEKAGRAEAARG